MRNSTSKTPVNTSLSGNLSPFGVKLRGRTFEDSTHRNTFNGKESDIETETQDYGMRIYDNDLGVFQSVDPITNKFPELTPYQFASNRPINSIDLDGLEATQTITKNAAGSTETVFHIIFKVKNTVGCSPSGLKSYLESIKSQVEKSYSGEVKNPFNLPFIHEEKYSADVSFDLTSPIDEKNDFYIEFVNKIDFEDKEKEPGVIGRASKLTNIKTNRFQILVPQYTLGTAGRVGAHELGHGILGEHIETEADKQTPKNPGEQNNLMNPVENQKNTKLTIDQLRRISENISKQGGTVGKKAAGRVNIPSKEKPVKRINNTND